MERKLRADAEAAALAAIDAVLPDKAVERALKGKRFPGRVFSCADERCTEIIEDDTFELDLTI